MNILHHLALAADDQPAWNQFLAALVDGDSVVMLDQSARALQRDPGCLRRYPQVRWLLPDCERCADLPELPAGIIQIDSGDWWQLIAAHPLLLEWN